MLQDISQISSLPETQPYDIITLVDQHASASRVLSEEVVLVPGNGTIPLSGIDIPFHSSILRKNIKQCRKFIEGKLLEENINIDKLIGKFIPNVIGKPFSLEADYVREVARITGSENLTEMLRNVSAKIVLSTGYFIDDL